VLGRWRQKDSWPRFSEWPYLEKPGGKKLRKTPNIYLWSSPVRTHTGTRTRTRTHTHTHTHTHKHTYTHRETERDRLWIYFVYVYVCVCSGSWECWKPDCVLSEDHLPYLSLLLLFCLFFSFGFLFCFVLLLLFFFWDRFSHGSMTHWLGRLGWLTSEPQGDICLYIFSIGLEVCTTRPYAWLPPPHPVPFLGINLRSLTCQANMLPTISWRLERWLHG
jgi:hypothetical protein